MIQKLAAFVIVTVAMVILSMAHRDSQAVRRIEQQAQFIADRFQAQYVDRSLPTDLPTPPEIDATQAELWREGYIYLRRNQANASPDAPQAVCYSDPAARLYLRANSRAVILFDGQRYEAVLLKEDAFRARAAQCGITLQTRQ